MKVERKLVLGLVYLGLCAAICILSIVKTPVVDFIGLSAVFTSMAVGLGTAMYGYKSEYDANAKAVVGAANGSANGSSVAKS
jgi:Na+-transporting methylmalonyl-CoA/oxaloacetate decarboxylase beta subunit